jgi:hypothetical protein
MRFSPSGDIAMAQRIRATIKLVIAAVATGVIDIEEATELATALIVYCVTKNDRARGSNPRPPFLSLYSVLVP